MAEMKHLNLEMRLRRGAHFPLLFAAGLRHFRLIPECAWKGIVRACVKTRVVKRPANVEGEA